MDITYVYMFINYSRSKITIELLDMSCCGAGGADGCGVGCTLSVAWVVGAPPAAFCRNAPPPAPVG